MNTNENKHLPTGQRINEEYESLLSTSPTRIEMPLMHRVNRAIELIESHRASEAMLLLRGGETMGDVEALPLEKVNEADVAVDELAQVRLASWQGRPVASSLVGVWDEAVDRQQRLMAMRNYFKQQGDDTAFDLGYEAERIQWSRAIPLGVLMDMLELTRVAVG